MRGKGIMKKKKTFFKKGHTYFGGKKAQIHVNDDLAEVNFSEKVEDSWAPRLTKATFDKVASYRDDVLHTVDADNRPGSVKLLRPKPNTATSLSESYLETDKDDRGEMRLVDKEKNTDMWNQCIQEHSIQSSGCSVPQFHVADEIKKGICWKQQLACVKCGYTGKMHKLYEDISTSRPGAKTAAPNLGLQVGLQESTCGNQKIRVILASANIPPPSKSGMQTNANTVGALTATLTSDSLKQRREDCKEINRLRGLSEKSPINIGIDVRYNSSVITERNKMGQNASQAIGMAIEHQTDERKIVALDVRNQLCSKGKRLRKTSAQTTCPMKHPGCTANTMTTEPLSEYKIGEEIGHMFARQNVFIRHVTTDGDARSAQGVATAMTSADPSCEVIRQADTTHLGQGQFRHLVKTKFSKDMFPGKNYQERTKQKKVFALDVKSRCFTVYNELHRHFKKYGRNMAEINERLPKTVDAILDCYAGNCRKCRGNFTACSGGKLDSWWAKSYYLSSVGIDKLNISTEDRQKLKAIIEMKLSEESTALQKLNTNTNKNEAVNRGISASLPKNVNFSRNVLGRASAAVDRMNHGLGESMLRKLEAVGSPVTKGGYVARAIRGFQHQSIYHTMYKKRKDVKRRNLMNRARAIRQHYYAYRNRVKAQKAVYRKGQIDPKPKIKRPTIKKKPIILPVTATILPVTATLTNVTQVEHSYCLIENNNNWRNDHSYCKT